MREVYDAQEGVIAGIKKYVDMLPSYDLEFFRVDTPQSPALNEMELYDIVLNNKNRPYDMYDVLARIFDGSQFMEYKKGYGPEMITGIAKVDGLLVGVVANQQGVFPNYPEYKVEKYGSSMGAGGKLYRQGLIKMNEFVIMCDRDRIPIIWFQDTSGIDLDDYAEDAELLDDVIVENRQAIEMCVIYRDIMSSSTDAFASIISNNLNITMKVLTSLTAVLSIPTIIASLWGMNVGGIPFAASPFGFWIVVGISVLLAIVSFIFMYKKQMFR